MISVALCTYNGAKFLREQLETLFHQTMKPDEIIISDDNSNDSTLEIVEEMRQQTDIKVLINRNVPGLGVFKNFEKAISLCSGDLIFCCDQDDIWHSDKIEKIVKQFDHPDVLLAFGNASVVLNDSSHYLYPLWEKKHMDDKENGTASYSTLVYRGGSIAGCCMAFRKSFFDSIVPFPDQVYHDDWLATCAAIKGKIAVVNEELIDYRQHGNNVVGIVRGGKFSYLKSLFTNPLAYIKHREYIYERHMKVYKGLFEHGITSDKETKLLNENLKFTMHRAMIRKQSYLLTFTQIISDFCKGYYTEFGKGIHEAFLDLYDLMAIAIFFRNKK